MGIVSAIYFILISWVLGVSLIKVFKFKLDLIVELVMGAVAGLILLTEIIFWQSFVIPFSGLSVLATTCLVLVICSLWWYKYGWLKKLVTKIKKVKRKDWLNWSGFVGVWGILFGFIWPNMLKREVGGLYAGWVNIWGDWAAHLTYTTSFAFGNNFPPEMPILGGAKFSYPFMADFLPAILIKLNSDLLTAMLLPSWWLSMLLVMSLMIIGREMGKSLRVAKITVMLFLLNGGLGFWWWFKDIQKMGIFKVMSNLPREYTHLEKLANIEWINIITSQVIPQRGFLMGFPLVILIYWWLYKYWDKRDKKSLLGAGVLTGLLALVHAHSVMIILVVGGVLGLMELVKAKKRLEAIKRWLWFLVPVVVIGGSQIGGFFGSSLGTKGFVTWQPGWLGIKRGDNLIWFWIKNLGLMMVWSVGGMKLAHKKLRQFSVGFWGVFILANLWIFQPWEWDNTKFIVHWYLMACVLGGIMITRGLKAKNKLVKAAVLLGFEITILAGFLDIWRLSQYEQRRIRFWNNEQLEMADWVRKETAPEARFVTADNHDHWLPTLTGRKTVMGYKGWLWTYGMDYSKQAEAVESVFKGGAETETAMEEYGIDYVVIGPLERALSFEVNEKFFEEKYRVVFENNETKIYSVND